MDLIRFVLASAGPIRFRLIAGMVLTSFAMGALMVVTNTATAPESSDGPALEMVLLFVVLAALVIGSHRYSMRMVTALSEAILRQIRDNYVLLVRRIELEALERTGVDRIYDVVARETILISDAAPQIVTGMISALTFVLLGVYIAYLSLFAIVLLVFAFVVTVYFYRYSQRGSRAALVAASAQETRFLDLMGHLLHGFKEVRQNAARGHDLEQDHLLPASEEIDTKNTVAMDHIASGMSISYIGFYSLLAAVVFILPGYIKEHRTVLQVLYTVLFMLSSLDNVLRSAAVLARANLSMEHLLDMEKKLLAAAREPEPSPDASHQVFTQVELRAITYSHTGRDGKANFTLGPCDLVVAPGQITYLIGGNGSGKSTLMRLLTGLYEPASGVILWDGQPVDHARRGKYRQLFSCVFADFHLFDRFYGARTIDPAKVNAMVADFGLAEKTTFRDGGFTQLDLSTGQRKRLALIVALLEDRPIYLLDEVGADQDPSFRHRFYTEILPDLRARGKAVIVISHDDRYFSMGDRVLTMRDGRLEQAEALT
ncbi:cyclic peptide export ABC transporter [Bradyrhizobium sp. HKCCYLR20261]|uniref:cyclic peptide export ABC transporter n=1 Tax=unclassified Bradyrhizobium TaxID=2631580 RepID=UPI003EBE8994